MQLWTVQLNSVLVQLQETGIYTTDATKITVPEFSNAYAWLASEMTDRISPPPSGVCFPVWAWYARSGRHSRPDIRALRWCSGNEGEDWVLMELEIPDQEVLLSDFDNWHLVLNDFPYFPTEDSDELDRLLDEFDALPSGEQLRLKQCSWKAVFDLHDMLTEKAWIQATFWVLRKEYIHRVWHFKTKETKALKAGKARLAEIEAARGAKE